MLQADNLGNMALCLPPSTPPSLPCPRQGTVGAGLPIISTLKSLLDTGDEVQRIEGVFRCGSGPLAVSRPATVQSNAVPCCAVQPKSELVCWQAGRPHIHSLHAARPACLPARFLLPLQRHAVLHLQRAGAGQGVQ